MYIIYYILGLPKRWFFTVAAWKPGFRNKTPGFPKSPLSRLTPDVEFSISSLPSSCKSSSQRLWPRMCSDNTESDYVSACTCRHTQAMYVNILFVVAPALCFQYLAGMVGVSSKLQIVGTFVGRIFHPKKKSTGLNPWPKNDEKMFKKKNQHFFWLREGLNRPKPMIFSRVSTCKSRVCHGFATGLGKPRVLLIGFPVRNPCFYHKNHGFVPQIRGLPRVWSHTYLLDQKSKKKSTVSFKSMNTNETTREKKTLANRCRNDRSKLIRNS